MTEGLNFDLPGKNNNTNGSQSKLVTVLLTAVLLAVLIDIGIGLMPEKIKNGEPGGAALSAEQHKKLALKLEKQGLNTASVTAWKDYIATAKLKDTDAARIWYRIGKLYQDENQYDLALNSFYRSEVFAKPDDISSEVARRIQECLEAMGKFAALRYELSDRVEMSANTAGEESDAKGDPVVAEIGPQKIMKTDLDRAIERRIERQMSQVASYLPEDEVKKKKEEMLKQFSTNDQRQIFLNQYLLEEVLYRKARESRIMDDTDVKAELKDVERSMLAAKVIAKELAESIKITAGDLETYYEANKHDYVRPERARISQILVRSEQKALDVRKKLKHGNDFAALARDMSQDSKTGKNGGELPEWVERNEAEQIPGIGNAENAMAAIFSTDEGKVVAEDIETEAGIHILKVLKREPETQKNFDEVKNEVFRALRSRKEREVQQQLFASLKEQYDVVVHYAAFADEKE